MNDSDIPAATVVNAGPSTLAMVQRHETVLTFIIVCGIAAAILGTVFMLTHRDAPTAFKCVFVDNNEFIHKLECY